jgi:hypothetical protein
MEFHGINWISCRIKERRGVTLEKLESNRKLVKLKWKYESSREHESEIIRLEGVLLKKRS